MPIRYGKTDFKAVKTDEGFITDTPVITRTGVFSYKQPDGTIRKELRHPDHVFAADSLATLRGIPVTNGHPGKVTTKNPQSNIGAVLTDGRQDGDNLLADITIHDTKTIDAGNKELSCGYECDLVEEQGTYNGERYDAIQTNIRHNHLAVVSKGRAGTARLNLDAAEAVNFEEEKNMPKIRLDSGIEYEAAQEVIQAHETLKQDAALKATECETQKARADKAEADLKAAKEAEAQIKLDAAKDAKERIELEAKAKSHNIEIKKDMKDVDVKTAVIKSIRCDADLTDKSSDYVNAMFDLVTQDASDAQKNTSKQREDMAADNTPKRLSADEARQKMINGDDK